MKNILLIEDNDIIRENTAEILELSGYRVTTANNGKAGIELALVDRPDLIICDIMMPVLDGYGVLHIVNKNPALTGIPFIFLTAKSERDDFRRGMELGADDYLTKPFSESELLSAIESRLNRFTTLLSDNSTGEEGLSHSFVDTQSSGWFQSLVADRKLHRVPKKQFVYSDGDEPTRLYFLKNGRVKIVRTSHDGKELVTDLFGPNSFIGYRALLENTNYTDSAVTLDDSELIYIPKNEFLHILGTQPEAGRQFVHLLAGHVNGKEEQLLSMAYSSLRRRVADTLLRLGTSPDGEPVPPIQLSRDDLAAVIGTATESLIRILTEFKHDGLIEMSSAGIRIVEPDKLRRANW
ncbi:response regulator [Spirosoma linguale]|uniref:Transcriptional regulator, Crp/Fnr family n=1 Tax=Spirosoma linguale (strain ATCC 33905 / DSM 74 / LMG 10896 / Claus 1) TaxID=504472 RepID=D2QLW5_SPILD|nr:transcriptional regulator, Crp/Fnr family [Spirosoma linguale DSM 74]